MSEKFLVGTKFYRHIGDSPVPDVIRLKKQEGDTLFFSDGGYTTTITKEEYRSMIKAGDLYHDHDMEFIRRFSYFGTDIRQKWELLSDDFTEATSNYEYLRFKVSNIGMKMSINELKKNYVRLIPDGFFTISNAQYPINNGADTGFDVMCTLHRKNENTPSLICRQDIIDVFTFTNSENIVPIGLSVSKRTCPKNMDFSVFMYSTKAETFKCTAVYLDDSINTILKFVSPLGKYNATMRKLFDKYSGTKFVGCQSNIYDLLVKTGFYEGFKEVFGILTYPFKLDPSRYTFTEGETKLFNSHIRLPGKKSLKNLVYFPYDRGIDTDRIGSRYLFVRTGEEPDGELYIVSYQVG